MTHLTRLAGAILAASPLALWPITLSSSPPTTLAVAQPGQRAADVAHTFGGEKSVTMPSRDAVMGFSFPVSIAEVSVIGGEQVAKGQRLVRAEDDDIAAAVELQRAQSESTLDIELAEEALKLAEIEAAAIEASFSGDGASKFELDRARSALSRRTIELGIARFEHEQAARQLVSREAQLARYSLVAPFDGRVDSVFRQVGHAVRESEPVIRVVRTDPLWIDVPAPTDQSITLGLKPGDSAWVLVDVPGRPTVHVGRIIEVRAVADPTSGTRIVRVEVGNPGDWPAGLTAWVRFTQPTGDWAGRIASAAGEGARR